MVRNHYVQGEYFFLPTKGVRNFWEWNLPLNQDKIQRLQRDYQRMKGTPEGDSLKALFNRLQIPELKGTTELQRTAELRILALDNIKSDPVYFVKNYFKRFVQLLSPLIRSFSSLVKISYFIYYTPILILTILGIYYYLRKIPELWLFFLIILSFFLITPIFYWRGRFKLIVEPYMIMFASLYMAQLWKRWHHKKL
jgi:hypothetical protein